MSLRIERNKSPLLADYSQDQLNFQSQSQSIWRFIIGREVPDAIAIKLNDQFCEKYSWNWFHIGGPFNIFISVSFVTNKCRRRRPSTAPRRTLRGAPPRPTWAGEAGNQRRVHLYWNPNNIIIDRETNRTTYKTFYCRHSILYFCGMLNKHTYRRGNKLKRAILLLRGPRRFSTTYRNCE